jgi:hypothetical protein
VGVDVVNPLPVRVICVPTAPLVGEICWSVGEEVAVGELELVDEVVVPELFDVAKDEFEFWCEE